MMKIGLRGRSCARSVATAIRGGVLLAALAIPGVAMAQDDVQGLSVRDRHSPEYSRQPIRAGNVEIFPEITVSSEYNDNIYAQNSGKIDDVILSVRPGIYVLDRRSDRVLSLRANGGYRTYLDNGTEDSGQVSATANARFGLNTLTRYYAGGEFAHNTESRRSIDSFSGSADPITYTSYRANLGIEHDIGPFTASLEGTGRSVVYDGSTFVNGDEIDLGFRDFTIYSGRGRLSYSRNGNNRIYVQATYDDRSYNDATGLAATIPSLALDRSSNGGRVVVGYSQQITELFFFDASIGYLYRDYDDPTLPSINGFAFEGSLLWNATPLTSIEVTGIRRVDETVNPLLSGLLRTEFQGRIDHELYRNLVLTAEARYALLDPIGSSSTSDEWQASLGARYNISRNWSLNLRGEHFERTNIFNLTQNRVTLGIRYNF